MDVTPTMDTTVKALASSMLRTADIKDDARREEMFLKLATGVLKASTMSMIEAEYLSAKREHRMMQHQATNVLKSAKAVAEWSQIRINQLSDEFSEKYDEYQARS